MPRLILNQGLVDERTYELPPGGVLSIGRSKDNDAYVLHRSLSRHHARVEVSSDGILLRDLESKNGTFVNGARVTEHPLSVGDHFRCGDLVFHVVDAVRPHAPSLVPSVVRGFETQVEPSSGEEPAPPSAAPEAPERARDKLEVLLVLSRLLVEAPSLDALLDEALALVFQILDADRATLLLLDERGGLAPRVSKGWLDGAPSYSRQIVDYVRSQSVDALFADARDDSRVEGASVLGQSIRAAMCARLQADEFLGVLYLDNLSIPNRFSAADLAFLGAVATQLALAVRNAALRRNH